MYLLIFNLILTEINQASIICGKIPSESVLRTCIRSSPTSLALAPALREGKALAELFERVASTRVPAAAGT